MISGNVPKHLVIGARTGFLHAMGKLENLAPFTRFTMEVPQSSLSQYLVDLGAAPMPQRERDIPAGDFAERQLEAKPINWVQKVFVSYNASKDDQTATLERKVRAAGEQFIRHQNNLAFQTLNGGDGTTYGQSYAAGNFFRTTQADPGAKYTTTQSNLGTSALNPTNFNTIWAAAKLLKDDQGEYTNHNYNLIITDPTTYDAAFQISKNVEKAATAERDRNPFANTVDLIASPHMDTGSWVLLAADGAQKPLIMVMREAPNLQHYWFDPDAPDGGRYYFKFYARYNILYGDWRLAYMGKT